RAFTESRRLRLGARATGPNRLGKRPGRFDRAGPGGDRDHRHPQCEVIAPAATLPERPRGPAMPPGFSLAMVRVRRIFALIGGLLLGLAASGIAELSVPPAPPSPWDSIRALPFAGRPASY